MRMLPRPLSRLPLSKRSESLAFGKIRNSKSGKCKCPPPSDCSDRRGKNCAMAELEAASWYPEQPYKPQQATASHSKPHSMSCLWNTWPESLGHRVSMGSYPLATYVSGQPSPLSLIIITHIYPSFERGHKFPKGEAKWHKDQKGLHALLTIEWPEPGLKALRSAECRCHRRIP